MDLSTFYEATITDCESLFALRAITIPQASLAPHVRDALFDWDALLGLTAIASLEGPEELKRVLTSLLEADNSEAEGFARTVVEQAHLVAGSPLGVVSLAETIARAVTKPDGTMSALLAQFEGSYLVLLATTDGIVLIAPVANLSSALKSGLERNLRDLMGLDGRKAQPLLSG